jgi:hypothetical protein
MSRKVRTVPKGVKISVKHFRSWQDPASGFLYNSDFPDGRKDILQPRGGATLADAFNSDGDWIASAEAYCSQKDNYNKRLGRQIAVGRLLKRLEANEAS